MFKPGSISSGIERPRRARHYGCPMRYAAASISDLLSILSGLSDGMPVEADADTGISATTVGELRELAALPGSIVVTRPREIYLETAIRISKAFG